jgi:hypothetical protein
MTDAATTTSAEAVPADTADRKIVPFFELSRLMVVALAGSSGRLIYAAQTKPNGPWDTNWTALDTTQTYSLMTAGITGDGRVAAVAQRTGATGISYIDETPDSIHVEAWNPPVDLGKPSGVNAFTSLTMAYDAGARLEIFGTDDTGRIWWKYQNPNRIVQKQVQVTPPGSTTPITVTVDEIAPPSTPWSDWLQLPGNLVSVRAVRGSDGRLLLFGINSGLHAYRCEQKTATALQTSDWTDWVQMDDNASGLIVALVPVIDKIAAVNLFAVTQNGQVVQARQSPPASTTWTGWSTPGLIREGVQALAGSIDGDGHVVLVATDKTKLHNVNQQWNATTQQWTGWIPFNGTDYPTQLALNYNADGRLTLFSHWLLPNTPPFGGLWCISQMVPDSSEWELLYTQLAPSDIRQYVVVRDLTPPT